MTGPDSGEVLATAGMVLLNMADRLAAMSSERIAAFGLQLLLTGTGAGSDEEIAALAHGPVAPHIAFVMGKLEDLDRLNSMLDEPDDLGADD